MIVWFFKDLCFSNVTIACAAARVYLTVQEHDRLEGSLYSSSPQHEKLLFQHGCLREDQSTCLQPGESHYVRSHHGTEGGGCTRLTSIRLTPHRC